MAPDLEASLGWFQSSSYQDAYGRSKKRYLMTRDGFALVVMAYTGDKALRFKVAYINEFNRMEAALKAPAALLCR